MSKSLPGSHKPGPGSKGILPIFMGTNHSIKETTSLTEDYNIDYQAQYSEVPEHIMFCQNRCLKIKYPSAWKMFAVNSLILDYS